MMWLSYFLPFTFMQTVPSLEGQEGRQDFVPEKMDPKAKKVVDDFTKELEGDLMGTIEK